LREQGSAGILVSDTDEDTQGTPGDLDHSADRDD